MRTLTLSLGLLLLAGCGRGVDRAYITSFSFERVAPEGLKEEVLSESEPREDSVGLYVRYTRESRVALGGTEPDAFARALAESVRKDLESRGFEAEIHNNEPCIYFVKFKSPTRTGSVFFHAKKEPEGVRLIFKINEADRG